MPITEIPKQVASSAEVALEAVKDWAGNLNAQDRRWIRMVGAGSLFTSAMLLVSGRRKAALTVATVGTVLVMLEEPKSLATAWAALPSFIQSGERFLGRLEGFVEQIASQGHRVRGFVDRAQR
jgi:hypothetical protein